MSAPATPPPAEGWVATLVNAVRSLTLTNVAIIALLVVILVPVYVIYRMLADPAVMDRLLSNFKEISSSSECVVREARERGGSPLWSIASGFAYAGHDRWVIAVVLPKEPTPDQIASYCATAEHIVENLQAPP